MGWTSYFPTHFTKTGAINRKAECDGYFLEGYHKGCFEVVKSVIKGSIYYAAVRQLVKKEDGTLIKIPENERITYAVIFRTHIDNGMFYYKDMSEFDCPAYYDCPESIIDLLSNTEHPNALEWRALVKEQREKPKLSALPIGTRIKAVIFGNEVFLTKHEPAYQFKTAFWMTDDRRYIPKTRITNFTVV